MRRSLHALLLLTVLGMACRHRDAPSPTLRERRDGLGRIVHLPPAERIRRVVSLAPSSTEILFAVGAGASLVGVDTYSDFPEAARALPRVGADVDPSLEKIVALRPDVVFTATTANNQRTTETLERIGVPVYVSRSDSLDEIYGDFEAVGDVMGRAAEATQLINNVKGRLAVVAARRRGAPRVKSLVVVWSDPLIVAGATGHVGDLLRAAGGENIADDAPQPFPTYSLERVVARQPEVIFVGTHATGSPSMAPLERLAGRAGAKRSRIEPLDGDLLFRPGPRIADGVELLDRLLHPSERAP